MKKLKHPILFITRTYPPVLGGMETLSYELTTTISGLTPSFIIKNPYGKKALPFFIPKAFLQAIYLIWKHKIRIVHLSDGVLAPVGFALRILFPRTKMVINIHGLDLTYADKFKIYYYTNIWAIKRMDRIIAVSHETKDKCIHYGVDPEKIKLIPNATHTEQYYLPKLHNSKNIQIQLWERFFPQIKHKIDFEKDGLILYLGRLAKRKGVAWFLSKVMPQLKENAVLLVAGNGPEMPILEKLIKKEKLENRVFLLGFIDASIKKFLLNACSMLIMPNISVPGDQEGFGITAIEAGGCGLVPVVSDLEGLKDAIQDKENGLRIPSEDAEKFQKAIEFLLENPKYREELSKKTRKYVHDHFDWEVIGKYYLEEFRNLEDNK